MGRINKINIRINSQESLENLLQKIYDECDMEMMQAQDQINLLRNSSDLTEESLDAKTKYSKAINDMLSIKEKMLKAKIDVGKVLAEILKFNGDVNKALNDDSMGKEWDIDTIKKKVQEAYNEEQQNYEIKK